MPTYEYKCDNCGYLFDVYQSMKDEKLTICPECGKNTLKRLIGTGGGLIFKGSGFYLTDYKNKPSEKTATSHSSAGSDTNKSGSPSIDKKEPPPSGTEGKPADKPVSSTTKTKDKSDSKDPSAKSGKN